MAGTVSGVPAINSVNLGSLESASASGGQAAAAAEQAVAAAANRGGQTPLQRLPSIISVQVLGYGGGDQPGDGSQSP